MSDNIILDALESLQKIKQMYNLKSTKSDKAIPVYKAEREVVEAVMDWADDKEPFSHGEKMDRVLDAVDNLKEVRRSGIKEFLEEGANKGHD